jgi:thymidylate synthase (FAD)
MDKGYTIPILGQGYVRYVDHLGSDQRIVETARISYKSPSKGEDQDKRLLFYLFRNRHTSPFEACNITFNIKMPIFCMRQFVRHRTFRLNEWSGRYSELADEFFTPAEWRVQDVKNKQGSVKPESTINGIGSDQPLPVWHEYNTRIAQEAFQHTYQAYQTLLERGVAKELARIVLPVSMFTEIYVNVDVHNLLHFLNLRQDEHAQKEIREIADGMAAIAEPLFPWTFEARNKFKVRIEEV